MEGVKGPEGDCVNESTVLKVLDLGVQCSASLLHFKLDVFDFLCILHLFALAPSSSLELLLLLSIVSLSIPLILNQAGVTLAADDLCLIFWELDSYLTPFTA